jgi:hypothetical protein
VTDELTEEKLKKKLLQETTLGEKRKIRGKVLELRNIKVTRMGERVYLSFSLKNLSRYDFSLGEILLSRGIADPQDSGRIMGFERVEVGPPTLESQKVPSGGAVKGVLSFDRTLIQEGDPVNLRVIEEGGLGRVLEFRDMPFHSR